MSQVSGRVNLAGQVALVTGAARGIGRAIALALAREGASVAVADMLDAGDTARAAQAQGSRAIALSCDVTDAAAVKSTVDRVLQEFGRIDILVNNVGGSIPGDAETITPEGWREQFEFNLHYVYHSMRIVAPLMAKQGGGAIVNISSIAGLRHLGNELAAYAASKAGLQHFSRVTAVRYAAQGVRVNTVIPGLMNTPLVAERLAKSQSGGDAAALIAKRHARTPTGRMGDAWDVAWAVVYLASDEAKFVTGAELVVDGGLTATIR